MLVCYLQHLGYAFNQCCLLLDQMSFGQTAFSSLRDRFVLNTQYFPEYYQVTAKVEFSVILPGRVKPLIGPRNVTATAMFDHIIDLETARRNGVKQALWQAAKKVVDGVTESW